MKIEELKVIANEFLNEHYGMEMEIPLERNNRLKRALGRFRHINGGRALNIDLAGFLLDNGTTEDIVGTLKHELIHYALFSKELPYKDGHPYFENELLKHGAPATRTNYVPQKRRYHRYECGCQTHIQANKLRGTYTEGSMVPGYSCSACDGRLTYRGSKVELR